MTFWEKLKSHNKPILALAPMAGITDSAFRQMCKEFGADLVYTEMVSVEGLQYAKDKVITKAFFEEMEHPIIVQLMGADPKKFAQAAKELEAMGVDGIDINFGCPVKKITKCESGVQLMENLDLAHDILEATINATSLPVSCKIRKSKYSAKEGRDITGLEFVEKMKDLDVAALMVHGRRYEQVHAGEVDMDSIKEIKKAFNGIVLANGGVKTPEDAKEMLEKTGADGIGIARGSNGRPYVFKQIREYLETGTYTQMTSEEIKKVAIRHVELSYKHKEGRGLVEMRKHLALMYIIAFVIIVTILSLTMKVIRYFLRKQLDLVVLKIQVPRYSGDEQDDKAPTSQDQLAERLALGEAFMASIANLISQKGIKPWIMGRTDYYSFEIVLIEGLIYFYVACPREMLDYMNEQISAQYPDAVINEMEDYNIFNPHGVIEGTELKFKKEYIYPIKTYRTLEADALNGITSGMAKLPDDAGATIQFLVRSAHPRWHNWGTKTASKASQGKKIYQAVRESRGLTLKPGHMFEGISSFLGSITATVFNQITNGGMKEGSDPSRPDDHYSLTQKEQEIIKGIEDKSSKAGLEANIRIIVSAKNEQIAKASLENIVNSMLQFNIYEFGNAFMRVKRGKKKLVKNFIYREFNENSQLILNSEEAASIFHFPQSHIETPNIAWLQSRMAPPPINIPKEGLYLGENVYRGKSTPIYFDTESRRRHMYIIGMTGTGKSKFMDMLAIRDMEAGHGMCFIDPHGDDVDLILANVPKERMDDVVYFDPSDYERPFGLNMLEYDYNKPEDKIFVVNQVFEIFDRLYDLAATGGPMFEQYMKNACMLIMDDPESGSTLMEISRVLADEDYRNYKLTKSRTPVVKDFWEKEATKAGGEASLANMVPYITSKLTPFIANDLMRPIISQQKTTLDFVDAMNNQKIILVKLSKGKIGDINANLLGMIIIGKLLQAAFTRADVEESQRKDFFLYIDEFQNFLTPSINTILSEARKYRLCLTIAHQYLGQLVVNNDEKIKNAIFGNVGTKLAFRIGVEDAEMMVEEFKPVFGQYDVMNVPKANCIIKLLIDNANPPPFSMLIPWVPRYFDKVDTTFTDELRKQSKLKYGKDKAEIEAEVAARRKFGAKPGGSDIGKKKDISLEDLFS